MVNKQIIQLGEFECPDGKMVISDPCYDIGIWCQAFMNNFMKGAYKATATTGDIDGWGNRCLRLSIAYAALSEDDISKFKFNPESFDIGVDSGQCGFFALEHYKDDSIIKEFSDDWYDYIWEYVVGKDNNGKYRNFGVMPFGTVSFSGLGDGSYTLYTHKNLDGLVDAAYVSYIDED